MNVKTVKIGGKRYSTKTDNSLNIIRWGYDNLYPYKIDELINSSVYGGVCLDRYQAFLTGNGFMDKNYSELILNEEGQTADHLQNLVSADLARKDGFCIHFVYNANLTCSDIFVIPINNVRFCMYDPDGRITKVAVFDDWQQEKEVNGQVIQPTKKTIKFFDLYSPDKYYRKKRIEEYGGIENYPGQILYVNSSGMINYPLPIYDKAVTQISTDEGLSNISYRNVRCNFLPFGMLMTRRSNTTDGLTKDEIAEMKTFGSTTNDIESQLLNVQTDENTSKILSVEYDFDADKPEFQTFSGNNYDKDFTETQKYVEGAIYAAFQQEPFFRIKNGSIGFSDDIMVTTYSYYNSVTDPKRRVQERAFDIVNFEMGINTDKSKIQPLKYINAE